MYTIMKTSILLCSFHNIRVQVDVEINDMTVRRQSDLVPTSIRHRFDVGETYVTLFATNIQKIRVLP